MHVDEQNNVQCIPSVELALHSTEYILWLAIAGTLGGLTVLFGIVYFRYFRPSGSFKTTGN